jgi:hypothetical protein
VKVYTLEPKGDSVASYPSNSPSDEVKVLYFIRRHGKRATDEQIYQFGGSSNPASSIQKLVAGGYIRSV